MSGIIKIQDLLATMSYEHRKKDGTLLTKGEVKIDKKGNKHYIIKNEKGKVLQEKIVDKDGNVLKEK